MPSAIHAMDPWETIPPAERTRPLSLTDAAFYLGFGSRTQNNARRVKHAIESGHLPAIPLGKAWVFSIRSFPADSHRHIIPAARRR